VTQFVGTREISQKNAGRILKILISRKSEEGYGLSNAIQINLYKQRKEKNKKERFYAARSRKKLKTSDD